eukprot:scaffold4141_cov335-Prasinococcus_capsulatus_cf.AAC.2
MSICGPRLLNSTAVRHTHAVPVHGVSQCGGPHPPRASSSSHHHHHHDVTSHRVPITSDHITP